MWEIEVMRSGGIFRRLTYLNGFESIAILETVRDLVEFSQLKLDMLEMNTPEMLALLRNRK